MQSSQPPEIAMQFPQWYVYILRSLRKDFIYVGSTDNLQRRLLQHNRGEVQSTKPYAPLMLEAYVAVHTEQKARQIEKYFKAGSGKAILKKRILQAPAQNGSNPNG
jgi:putative endonuclease